MTITRCPHCGTANREGSNFCNRCGVELRARGRQEGELPSKPKTPEQAAVPAATPPEEERPAQPSPPDNVATDRQPWLRVDFSSEEDAPPFEEEEEAPLGGLSALAPGVRGLLTPVRVAVHGDEADSEQSTNDAETTDSQVDLWRRVRTRMASPPLLAGLALSGSRPPLPDLQIRWLFLILALAVTVPALFKFAWPSGSATQWPGVEEAFLAIDGLPVNATVLIYWAYDPSTAGELDLEALPVTEHLFQQRARISIVTQLPGGPATARRLVERARLVWQRTENLTVAAESTWAIPVVYLPGGASILALVGQNPGAVFVESDAMFSPDARATLAGQPDLTIVFGAQADDVQHWLEQVQPLSPGPVVAVVAAGADPVVRPYLDSGQLAGLVSGFDGAYNYQRLLDEQAGRAGSGWLDMQLVLQDWGQFVFFLAIVLGNFAAVLSRGQKG